jgi:hypothetical protein
MLPIILGIATIVLFLVAFASLRYVEIAPR